MTMHNNFPDFRTGTRGETSLPVSVYLTEVKGCQDVSGVLDEQTVPRSISACGPDMPAWENRTERAMDVSDVESILSPLETELFIHLRTFCFLG